MKGEVDMGFSRHDKMVGIRGVYEGPKGSERRITDAPYCDGTRYHMDVNVGNDSYDGLSWAKPFKTFARATIVNDANIARGAAGYASRNQLLVRADNSEASKETIVDLPNKCDVIGVGSYDGNAFPIFFGAHLLAGSSMGCRFYNVGFRSLDAGGAVFTHINGNNNLAFYGCYFLGHGTTPATYGLVLAADDHQIIKGCHFIGAFSTAAIRLGTGAHQDLIIEDNIINSGAIGISVHASLSCTTYRNPLIKRNSIYCKTLTVDDDSSKCKLEGNRMVTTAAHTLSLILDYQDTLAMDNIITDATVTAIYPVLGSCAS